MFRTLLIGGAVAVSVGFSALPAPAAPLAVPHLAPPPVELLQTQGATNSRGFRRCMRAKYGPRYFARVPRAHRWHMSQACMA